jgi:PAS domain S-box-containing protein
MADRVHEDATITDDDREFIVSFANQIAIALENAILYRKIAASERKYRELVENAHDGIWIIDEQGVIKFANRRMREITGQGDLENITIYDLVDQDNLKLLEDVMAQNRMHQVAQQELEITSRDRGLASVIMSSVPMIEDGHFAGAFAMFSDITALRETEKRFRKIFEEAAHGMSVVDMEGNIMDVNPAFLKMLGFKKQEVVGKSFKALLLSEDAGKSSKLFKELCEGIRDSFSRETRYRHKDNRVVWGQVTVSLLRAAGGAPQYAIAMIADITQRKKAEEEIRTYQEQLQSLASELSLTEERERHRLATDLHDHIGQALAVSKIKLGVLQKSAPSQDQAKSLGEVRELIEQMIHDTRSLTFELSLPVLYELGFESAVEWFAKHIRSQHGIIVDVQKELVPIPMDDEINSIFRSVRLMINIVKHAQAHNVRVTIRMEDDGINIEVEDDGVGIKDVPRDSRLKSDSGFGLFSIRERLHYLGGRVQVESEKDRGTRITLMVPRQHIRKTQLGIAR